MKSLFSILCLAFAVSLPAAWADTVTLRDGTQIDGTMVSATRDSIVIRDQSGLERRYQIREVDNVAFSDSGSSRDYNSSYPGNNYPRDNRDNNGSYNNGSYNSRDGYRGSMTIPSGAEVSVRTNETIDSSNARPGQTFSAVLSDDILDQNGQVLASKGSDATLVLRDVSTGGTTSGGEVVLDLDSITVAGRRYQVSTEDLEQKGSSGLGKNRRTATMVGGGAALGTLLGAIAGGGKGALIGAVSGAAVGAGVQVLTKGKQVKVPEETVLKFRLDQPLYLSRVG